MNMGCFYMIVINRKRLMAILSMICVSVLVFSFQIARKEETVQTVALPVSSKVIVIDAGHGVPDEGAQSSTRYHRSTNKFKNCIKTSKFVGTKWLNSNINS